MGLDLNKGNQAAVIQWLTPWATKEFHAQQALLLYPCSM